MATKKATRATAAKPEAGSTTVVTIKPPDHRVILLNIRGTSPLMVNQFSHKAQTKIEETQKAGSTARGKRVRDARDFEADCEAAKYKDISGWCGMNAAAFRNAAISACRVHGFKMTVAKLSIFTEADGYDVDKSTPLVRIYGEPKMDVRHVRNATGVVDLRARPVWPPGWTMKLRMRYDASQFTETDVVNLIATVGLQVGIGEGRPDSRDSAGIGFGLFEIVSDAGRKR